MKKTIITIGVVVVLIILFVGLRGSSDDSTSSQPDIQVVNQPQDSSDVQVLDSGTSEQVDSDSTSGSDLEVNNEEIPVATGWKATELTNVLTGETYTIGRLAQEKPVLIESFAVWCPKCTSQQKQVKELHGDSEFGDSFYSVALNTDPNEDANKIKDHADSNGFDWRYSVSPDDVTNSLIEEFGISIVSAPSVPMILACPDGTSHFLSRGVKSAASLKNSIETLC